MEKLKLVSYIYLHFRVKTQNLEFLAAGQDAAA
jgi:hypothetical protein